MDMQREDFMRLCKGPKDGGYFETTITSRGCKETRFPTHHGMGGINCQRILDDWFPEGSSFEFLGTVCFSKGANRDNWNPMLEVLAGAKDGGIETLHFSVREALSIAKQISVDTINRLNGVNHREL